MTLAVYTAAQNPPSHRFGSNSRHADKPIRQCQECGHEILLTQASRFLCSDPCRTAFNNRRKKRGAEIYDLVMAWRYERGLAKALGLFKLICRLASVWRQEDRDEREGRNSWADIREVSTRLNRYRATIVFRPGEKKK